MAIAAYSDPVELALAGEDDSGSELPTAPTLDGEGTEGQILDGLTRRMPMEPAGQAIERFLPPRTSLDTTFRWGAALDLRSHPAPLSVDPILGAIVSLTACGVGWAVATTANEDEGLRRLGGLSLAFGGALGSVGFYFAAKSEMEENPYRPPPEPRAQSSQQAPAPPPHYVFEGGFDHYWCNCGTDEWSDRCPASAFRIDEPYEPVTLVIRDGEGRCTVTAAQATYVQDNPSCRPAQVQPLSVSCECVER
jgi:hypothetical protein